jgi:hypothetical protein
MIDGVSRLTIAALMVLGLAACAGGAPPSSAQATVNASPSTCQTDALSGTYARQISAGHVTSTGMVGSWTLTIEACRFEIRQDGALQGSGRIDLVDGTAERGRIGLSEDQCPNEFRGTGLYDITADGDQLSVSEAITGTDQCVGRAQAFVTPPLWEMQ